MTPALRETSITAVALLIFSIVGAAGLAGTFFVTRANIEASERKEKLDLITQVLPKGSFDNDLVSEARPLPPTPELGLQRAGEIYVARMAGRPVGMVVEAVAPDGYAGEIRLLIGILANGRISGVRVTAHSETPGLGDYIDIRKGNWITQFNGRSANDPSAEQWHVKKDGGRFEYLAGATITPRAVVKAVHKALVWFEAHRGQVLTEVKS